MINRDEFIEYCEVHTNMYGTAKSQITAIQKQNKIPLLDIDVQGAIKFEKAFPDSNFIAIIPPSVESLKQRLEKRGSETEKTMSTRLANAPGEIELMFKLRNTFQFRIVNSDLQLAKSTFNTLITALYQEELRGEPSNLIKGQRPAFSSHRLFKTLGLLAGLVLVHEVWRNRRSLV